MLPSVEFAIVGNGIVAMAIAEQLHQAGKKIALIAPKARPASASVAAAAMLNSFAELSPGALNHELKRYKFLKSREATSLWPSYLRDLHQKSGIYIPLIMGTSLVKIGKSSEAYREALLAYLREYEEPYRLDSHQGLTIPGECAVQPSLVFQALDRILKTSDFVSRIDAEVQSVSSGETLKTIHLKNGQSVQAEQVVLAAGSQVTEICEKSEGLKNVLQLFYGRGIGAHLYLLEHGLNRTYRTFHDGANCGVYLIPYNRDSLYLGATSELQLKAQAGDSEAEIKLLLERAIEGLYPKLQRAKIEKTLMGYRPTTADAFPLMGETSIKGVWVASGTKRDGFHLAPVIAREISKGLLKREPVFGDRFLPERKLYFLDSEAKVLEQARAYFGGDELSLKIRWGQLKARYLKLDAGVAPELWPLFEKGWVHPDHC